MQASKSKGPFENVGECLYRYKPSGIYYARIKKNGKEFRQSLKTTDRVVAKANLSEKLKDLEAIDPAAGKITVEELCDQHLLTIQHRKRSTIQGRAAVVKRFKAAWPEGKTQQVKDVKPSHVVAFLNHEGSRMGKSSYLPAVANVHSRSTRQVHTQGLPPLAAGNGILLNHRLDPLQLRYRLRRSPKLGPQLISVAPQG